MAEQVRSRSGRARRESRQRGVGRCYEKQSKRSAPETCATKPNWTELGLFGVAGVGAVRDLFGLIVQHLLMLTEPNNVARPGRAYLY